MEWKEVRLGDLCSCQEGYVNPSQSNPKYFDGGIKWIRAVDLNNAKVYDTSRTLTQDGFESAGKSALLFEPNTIVISKSGTIGRLGIIMDYMCGNRATINIKPNDRNDLDFIFYMLLNSQKSFSDYAVGSVQKNLYVPILKEIKYVIPEKKVCQRRIAAILSSLDRKIELNNKINAQLEEMAQAIFKSWFVDFEPFKVGADGSAPTHGSGKFVESELGLIPEGWRVGTLTEIANYVNGLAMQKYPPADEKESLPVLKIKELGQGQIDSNSDRCRIDIKPDFIINDGDVVFSWSGTLLVDIWCGGKCGLNQHLFKVTSEKYPMWFYLYWTKHHLNRFIRIAKDKAVTMGHIKRGELDTSVVIIPDEDNMKVIDAKISPIVDLIINNRLSNRNLSHLRDTLLPKLMSGEIEIM